jgi:hypothetical protein
MMTLLLGISTAMAQKSDTTWTAKDKQFLIVNYQRALKEVNDETKSLTVKQWNFREKEGAWTISEVIEHLNMWALVTQEHERYMLYNGKRPELALICPSDSANTTFIYEEKLHSAPDFTIPTGQIPDRANLNVFNVYHERIIANIKKSDLNFRLYLRTFTDGYMTNMNQAYIIHFGHVDRHLRQVRRIKSNAAFPK